MPMLNAERRVQEGNKVVDHERISGVRAKPFDAAVVFEVRFEVKSEVKSEVSRALISKVWFFNAD